ncbi:MAG: hypothetical protein NTV34_03130, partial [Proteobacteria bacterium]|nr:hypothetical protein [Pseudomonadota bacterium]
NGKIDSVNELFHAGAALEGGLMAPSGFDHLASYDADFNGKIDVNDPVYSKLLLWRDRNGDGMSQPDEIKPLSEVVKSISVNGIETKSTYVGLVGSTQSRISHSSSFVRSDGKVGTIYNVFFSLGLNLAAQTYK